MPKLIDLLRGITEAKAPGPTPSFSSVHVLKVIWLIRDYGPIGRSRLAQLTGLGEGSIKTLLNRLRAAELIEVTDRGVILTNKGRLLGSLLKRIVPKTALLSKMPITIGRYGYGVMVKGMAGNVRIGLEQRDEAIKAGASGATTIIKVDNELILPPSLKLSQKYPETSKILTEIFEPENNDVIVIGCADDPLLAEYGALAAVLTLIGDIKTE